MNNIYGNDIATFRCHNYEFAGVHGDLDKVDKVVQNIGLMTNIRYDAILTGHNHHFLGTEDTGTTVIGNPSLMGADDLSIKLRKASVPA